MVLLLVLIAGWVVSKGAPPATAPDGRHYPVARILSTRAGHAPDFEAPGTAGPVYRFSEMASHRLTVVTFWRRTGRSREEFRAAANFSREMTSAPHVRFLDIAVGLSPPEAAREAMRLGVVSPVLCDQKGLVAEIFGARGDHVSVVVDLDGTILYNGTPDGARVALQERLSGGL